MSEINKNNLADKTILVTGAGSGVGKAAAIAYASNGANVILLGKTSSKLEKVYDEIENLDCPTPSISLMNLLVANTKDYQELIDNLLTELNKLDGLLLNAAILGDRSPIEQYDVQKWVETIHINLTSQFILVKTLLPALKKSANASVVFTSSGVGN
jgi:NADP-dependent 3-hydroxy acid dehydrogenase YdfG